MKLKRLIEWLGRELEISKFDDVSNNGIQIGGPEEVKKVAFAVDASLESVKAAVAAGAQLLVVHHGISWGGGIRRIEGGIYNGGKYNNFGIHGTGIATAADSLAAICKYVYEEKTVTASQLIAAVDSDFENYSELLHMLRYEAPKMGNNEGLPDSMAVMLLEQFAASLEGRKNCRGGCYRAGTGSAMYYLWHANDIGASPDGRRKGEPFGTNFSASLFAKILGPLSVINSFPKPDLPEPSMAVP
jgi:pyruvate-formate lyase